MMTYSILDQRSWSCASVDPVGLSVFLPSSPKPNPHTEWRVLPEMLDAAIPVNARTKSVLRLPVRSKYLLYILGNGGPLAGVRRKLDKNVLLRARGAEEKSRHQTFLFQEIVQPASRVFASFALRWEAVVLLLRFILE